MFEIKFKKEVNSRMQVIKKFTNYKIKSQMKNEK
jgi:hypothetical protein